MLSANEMRPSASASTEKDWHRYLLPLKSYLLLLGANFKICFSYRIYRNPNESQITYRTFVHVALIPCILGAC